ncbi:MAG: metallopeptidase family protein [Thermoguttaceae bacterium]|jgi:predicted Zn-dependent protease with MMP-like domain
MDAHTRRLFDKQLERVLAEMPPLVLELLEKVPLYVEDYPSADVMKEMGLQYRDDLCGLYTGIPINERSISHSGQMPDVVTIFREGIWSMAADDQGRVAPKRLRHDIRVTILHELAHHHGLSEEELEELGYG